MPECRRTVKTQREPPNTSAWHSRNGICGIYKHPNKIRVLRLSPEIGRALALPQQRLRTQGLGPLAGANGPPSFLASWCRGFLVARSCSSFKMGFEPFFFCSGSACSAQRSGNRPMAKGLELNRRSRGCSKPKELDIEGDRLTKSGTAEHVNILCF